MFFSTWIASISGLSGLKFRTVYWLYPGSPFMPVQRTAWCPSLLHGCQGVPTSLPMGIAHPACTYT